ncbi:13623_t:CDS:2 [Racocetra fulgida]|uniref:13623_t:CDS:1 n=1 Tax=Racocetra fulgida TaxID=60492 RepID=A0A9N9AFJ3_9GLOM|nr:13623_t:CDS:2 [Racocetra fulgida]
MDQQQFAILKDFIQHKQYPPYYNKNQRQKLKAQSRFFVVKEGTLPF